jgi:hypothetical protein
MKIVPGSNRSYTNDCAQPLTAASANAASFASELAAANSETSTAKKPDFTGTTRKAVFDWMNDQIQCGKMTFEESGVFLGMTMKISVATGQPVDMATDTTRINFIEKASLGIEGARSRNDFDLIKRLQSAIDTMNRK